MTSLLTVHPHWTSPSEFQNKTCCFPLLLLLSSLVGSMDHSVNTGYKNSGLSYYSLPHVPLEDAIFFPFYWHSHSPVPPLCLYSNWGPCQSSLPQPIYFHSAFQFPSLNTHLNPSEFMLSRLLELNSLLTEGLSIFFVKGRKTNILGLEDHTHFCYSSAIHRNIKNNVGWVQ